MRFTLAGLAIDVLDRLVTLPFALVIFLGVIPIAFLAIVGASLVMLGIALVLSWAGALLQLPMVPAYGFLISVVLIAFILLRWYVRVVGRRAIDLGARAEALAAEKLLPPERAVDQEPVSPAPSLAELDARLATPRPPASPA